MISACAACNSSGGWTPLFDGKSLEGWRSFRAPEVREASWRVEDGAIVSQSEAGDLITEARYDNFELAFEWKVSEAANSGVLFRVDEAAERIHHSGLEYQVLDNEGDAGRPLTEQAGAAYGIVGAPLDVTRPVGSWNEARLIVDGDRVTHVLNGVVLLRYEIGSDDWTRRVAEGPLRAHSSLGQSRVGHIALQNYHGHRVEYRNLRIRELPARE